LPLRFQLSEVSWLQRPVAYRCFRLFWLLARQAVPRFSLPTSAPFGHTFWEFLFSSLLSGFIKADALANAVANRVFSAKWFCGCRPWLSPSRFCSRRHLQIS